MKTTDEILLDDAVREAMNPMRGASYQASSSGGLSYAASEDGTRVDVNGNPLYLFLINFDILDSPGFYLGDGPVPANKLPVVT